MLSISPASANIITAVPTASAIARVRVVTPRDLGEASKDMPESEQNFVLKSRQATQRRMNSKKKSAVLQEADRIAVEDLAKAMLDVADGEIDAVRDLPRDVVAAEAEVTLKGKHGDRLWVEAVGLARDVARQIAEAEANGKSDADVDCFLDYDRDLRIAADAMTSIEAVQARDGLCERPYSDRQAHMVRRADDRIAYLDRVRSEPGVRRVNYRDEQTVALRFVQDADDRFDLAGQGYVFDEAAWVGGSSTQANGGTCFQRPFAEKGKRSAASPMTMRVVAAIPKVRSRRRGISDKAVIQRIMYLADSGKAVKAIAAEVGEKESRIKGVIHAFRNDTRFHSGPNNDRRVVHMKKRVALDQVHGNLRTDCREVIRVDIDEIFESWAEFEDYLRTLLVQPQQIVYVRDDRYPERVTKPHLLYILPEKKGVWYNNPLGMAMFNGAAAALTVMAGGDIGGLANVGDIKLPTSPHNVAIDWSTEHLPDLSELCRVLDVDLKNGIDRVMRNQSVAQMFEAGIDKEQSGAIYTLGLNRGWEIGFIWEAKGELRINSGLDRRKLGEELHQAFLEDAFILKLLNKLDGKKRSAAEKSLLTAARKVAERFGRGPEAGSRGYDLGAAEIQVTKAVAKIQEKAPDMSDIDRKAAEVRAAQQAGQTYAKKVQVDRTRRRIADAMSAIAADGTDPTVDLVTGFTGMDARTIGRHWDPAVALLAANAICAVIMSPKSTDTTCPPVETFCSGVWGVPEGDSLSEQPASYPETKGTASGEWFTLDSVLSPPIRRLVNRLPRWNPSFGPPTTGRNMTEFCRSGWMLYRSKLGIREQSQRRQKGRRDNPAGSMVDVTSVIGRTTTSKLANTVIRPTRPITSTSLSTVACDQAVGAVSGIRWSPVPALHPCHLRPRESDSNPASSAMRENRYADTETI
jgi:hypothetical protein